MSKTAYHIQLKGYVGGYDFDRKTVDNVLSDNEGKTVNVRIDSLGDWHHLTVLLVIYIVEFQ